LSEFSSVVWRLGVRLLVYLADNNRERHIKQQTNTPTSIQHNYLEMGGIHDRVNSKSLAPTRNSKWRLETGSRPRIKRFNTDSAVLVGLFVTV